LKPIKVEGFLTNPKARPLSLTLEPAARLAILGPSASGKSRLLNELENNATNDSAILRCSVASLKSKSTPLSLARPFGADPAAVALDIVKLWDLRNEPASNLSTTQRQLMALLPGLCASEGFVLIDQGLDGLALWNLEPVLNQLLNGDERAVTVVTSRCEIAERFEKIAVLTPRGLAYFGSPSDLIQQTKPIIVEVEASNSKAVQHMAQALNIRTSTEGQTTTFKIDGGQEKAVRLALQGYSYIKSMSIKKPSLKEALEELWA